MTHYFLAGCGALFYKLVGKKQPSETVCVVTGIFVLIGLAAVFYLTLRYGFGMNWEQMNKHF